EFEIRSRVDNGNYRMPILPGKGYLAVSIGHGSDPRYGIAGDVPAGVPEFLNTKPFTISPTMVNALIELNPAAEGKDVKQDVLLTPGRGVLVTIVGPDGEKLKGVVATSDNFGRGPDKLNDDGTLTVRGISANQPKYVQAVCP